MKRPMATRWFWWGGVGVLAVAAVLTWYLLVDRAGVRVTVTNSGTDTLRDLTVHVTGRSYDVGDLPPGDSRTVSVNPRGESHVEIAFSDKAGTGQRLDAGGYFEPGYRGTIDIVVGNGKLVETRHEVELPGVGY